MLHKTRPLFVSGREPSGSRAAKSDCLLDCYSSPISGARKGHGKTAAAFLLLSVCHVGPVRTHQKASFCSIKGKKQRGADCLRGRRRGERGGKGRGLGDVKRHHAAPSSGRKAKFGAVVVDAAQSQERLSESRGPLHACQSKLGMN